MIHKPVLTKEVLEYLDIQPNENIIDGTIGQAGHTLLLLQKNGPQGKVLGIDRDLAQIENARRSTAGFKDRAVLVHDSYANIKEIAQKNNITPVHGVLLDLGYSSWHMESSNKGFSFQKDETLDMRYGQGELTAEKIINEWPQENLQKILQEFGEEKFARQIAKEIVQRRRVKKIESTFELIEVIKNAIPGKFHQGRIHYATKSFQALRIAVNDELGALEKVLPDAVEILSPSGRLVIISFHSLEDRIVKNFFRQKEQENVVKILTKKPITADHDQVVLNPRSRSAKLRAIIKS